MDDARQFSKWAGWSGVIGTVAFLGTALVTNLWTNAVDGLDGPGDMLRFLADVSDYGMGYIVYGALGILFCVIYIPMCFGVHRRFAKSTRSWFGSVAVVAGLGILLPAYVISILQPYGFATAAEELSGSGGEALFVVYEVAAAASFIFFTAGSVLTLSFGPYLWAREVLRTGAFSKWLGWLGLLVGISGLIWFVWLMDSPVVLPILILNVLSSLVFFGGMSVALLRRPRSATA